MRTLISHFYNEEYLLPFWIDHHKNLFENAILIDYGSTDNSLQIIHQKAPKNWKVVKTKNKYFDAFLVDHEIMEYEKKIKGWKIVLNTTEFLVSGDLDKIEYYCEKNNIFSFFSEGAVMVDNCQSSPIINNQLVSSKTFGFLETDYDFTKYNFDWYQVPSRNRIYHRNICGNYYPGRHDTYSECFLSKNAILILWYGFSPWNKSFIKRKQQIKNRLSNLDISNKVGTQHLLNIDELNETREKLLFFCSDLKEIIANYYNNSKFDIIRKTNEITNYIVLKRNHKHEVNAKDMHINILNFQNNELAKEIKSLKIEKKYLLNLIDDLRCKSILIIIKERLKNFFKLL